MTTEDPRERLVLLGNKVLDLCYEIEVIEEKATEYMDLIHEHLHKQNAEGMSFFEIAANIPAPEGVDMVEVLHTLMRHASLKGQRSTALLEYVTTRRVLEHADAVDDDGVEKDILVAILEGLAATEASE